MFDHELVEALISRGVKVNSSYMEYEHDRGVEVKFSEVQRHYYRAETKSVIIGPRRMVRDVGPSTLPRLNRSLERKLAQDVEAIRWSLVGLGRVRAW